MQSITDVIGSQDSTVMQAATTHLADSLLDESIRSKAIAWLRTLIYAGYPLRENRPAPSVEDDGGLLLEHLETEIHVFVLYSIAQAVRRDDYLDLSFDSTNWHYSAMLDLYRDLRVCGFTRSKECPRELFGYMSALCDGTPLFGDNFRTDWSFYTLLSNKHLGDFIEILVRAANYERAIPDSVPEAVRTRMVTCLCADAKSLITDLSNWFGRIQQAKQDALILWW